MSNINLSTVANASPKRREREDDTNNTENTNNNRMPFEPEDQELDFDLVLNNKNGKDTTNNNDDSLPAQRKRKLTNFLSSYVESANHADALWLAYVATRGLDHDQKNDDPAAKVEKDVIASQLAESLIKCYIKVNDTTDAMATFNSGCTQYFFLRPQHNRISDGLQNFFLAEKVSSTIASLLPIHNKSIATIAYEHFKSVVDRKLQSFYGDTTTLMMSHNFHEKSIRRFVVPGGESIDEGTITVSRVQDDGSASPVELQFASYEVNILSGWSGAGKTTLAMSKHPGETAAPVCIVLGVNDLFDDQNVSYAHFCAVASRSTVSRDILAAILLVNAVGRVLLQQFASVKQEHQVPTTSEPTLESILQHADLLFEPESTGATKERSNKNDDASSRVYVPDLEKIFSNFTSNKYNIHSILEGVQVRIVLDEGGACPVFVRAICNTWMDSLRPFFEKTLLVEQENLYFFVAGTGLDTFSAPSNGSFQTDYALYRVESGRLFAKLLQNAASSSATTAYGFYGKLMLTKFFDFLYETVNDRAIRQRPCTHQVKIFLQLVSDNARCAGLAMNYICAVVLQDKQFLYPTNADAEHCNIKNPSADNNVDGAQPQDLSASLLLPQYIPTWCVQISRRFVQLNGLSRAKNPLAAIGEGLSIVMSRREETLSAADVDLYLVKYGILVDAGEKAGAFRYRIQQSLVIMLLLAKNLGLSRPFISASETFEAFVADHHALCLFLGIQRRIVQSSPSSVKYFGGVDQDLTQKVLRVSLNASFKLEDGYSKQEVDNMLPKPTPAAPPPPGSPAPSPQSPLTFAKRVALFNKFNRMSQRWTEHIKSGGSVVIVNGPEASNADVFVLTKNMLFCTQCKYYKPSTALTGPDRKEFVKMITGPGGVFTRELLMNCCRGGPKPADGLDEVKVRASIVLFHEDSNAGKNRFAVGDNLRHTKTWDLDNGSKFTENFNYDARDISVLQKDETKTNEDDANGTAVSFITRSELYPILVDALDDAHLAANAANKAKKKNLTKKKGNTTNAGAKADENEDENSDEKDDDDTDVEDGVLWEISLQ